MGKKPFLFSVFLHLAVIAAGMISAPFIRRDYDLPPPVSIELVEIAAKTQTDKVAPRPVPPEEKKDETPPAPPRPPPPAKNTAAEAKAPIPKPPPRPEKKPAPPPEETVLVDKAAPPEKKKTEEEKKRKEVTEKPAENDFLAVLRNLQESDEPPRPRTDEPDLNPMQSATVTGAKAPLGVRLTMSEEDALRRQLERCWNVPIGAREAEDLRVEVLMVINQDRSLREARIVDRGRYQRDSFFRAAADSALRAAYQCSPFDLPPDKYEVWKTVTVTFDPSQMF